jgi:hypothetical protein
MNKAIFLLFCLGLCHKSISKEWKLVWFPEANKDGLKAFEGVEDERGGVHKTTHIFVEDNNYRFNMHTEDRDTHTDRQRQEAKGMVTNGHQMRMQKGDNWKFTYSMFIPSTLKATTSFTHIAQMKVPNAKPEDGAPIYVMSLRRHGDNETIEAKITTNDEMLGSTNLKPLHDKWIDVELEYYVDDLHGSAKWTIISDNKTVVHGEKENVKTFFHETVRPKWGIYRSLSDSKQLLDTYLLITKMRAYKFE